MARVQLRMPSPEGVAKGQTATFKLPIGHRYHFLHVTYGGVTLAQMTEIRVLANNKVIHRYSATDRDTMNKFDGLPAAGGILTIPFDRIGLKTKAGDEETALNTGSVNGETGLSIQSLHIEIDIDAGATAPVMSMHADVSENKAGGPGSVLHIVKHIRDASGAGEFDISDLPYGRSTSVALNRVWFKPSANAINKVVIERNTYIAFERTAELNTRAQLQGVRNPQAGFVVVDRTEKGYGGDPLSLAGVTDFRYKLTVTGAAAITVFSEYLGSLGD